MLCLQHQTASDFPRESETDPPKGLTGIRQRAVATHHPFQKK